MPDWNAIDISLYTGEVSQDQANQLVNAGLDLVVIGFDTTQLSDDQRDVFCQAGVRGFDVYRYVYFDRPLEPQIDNILTAIAKIPSGDMMPGYLHLDIEHDIGLAPQTVQQIIINSITLAKQGPTEVSVYSAKWFWDKYCQGFTWPADNGIKLWGAFWNGTLNIDDAPLFGGWTSQLVIGKQYAGNIPSIIPAVDGDVFRDRTPKPLPPAPMPPIDPGYDKRITVLEGDYSQLAVDLSHIKDQIAAINKATG